MEIIREIADMVLYQMDEEEGYIHVDHDFGDISIEVKGTYEKRGYCEDDYFSGTGAFVCTSRYVNLDAEAYDQEGNIIPLPFTVTELEELITK